ncbi:MAG: O-antigen ligase family protein, partial [Terriglobia bacterium]
VLALLFVVSPLGQPLRNRARTFQDDPGVTVRVLVWRDSLGLIAANPLLGTGLDTYELAFPHAESVELAQLAPDHYAESPHNLFLDSMAATGIPGGLLFIALVAAALLAYAHSSRAEPLEAGLFAALVAGLVAAQFSGETMATRLALLTLAGLSVAAPVAAARPAVRGAAGAFAVASLAVTLVFGSRLARADRALFQAIQAASRSDIELALEQGRRARAAFPWTGTHAFAFSRIAGRLLSGTNLPLGQRAGLLAAAEETARAGLLHSSQPQAVLVHQASLEVLQGKQQEAQVSLTSAIEAAPSWYRPRWLLAVLLASQGQLRQAAEQANAALDLGARVHPEIAASCQRILDLARAANVPEPGGFEVPQPVSADRPMDRYDRYDRCGGRIVLPRELSFERASSPVLSPGGEGAWDRSGVSHPRVLNRNGELLLWYAGFDGRIWRAGLTQSRDGAAWQKRPQPLFDASELNAGADSEAVRGAFLWEQDRFLYWYAAGEIPRIGFATSLDGETWSRHPVPVLAPGSEGAWDGRGVTEPHVVRCGQTLLLFYVGLDSLGAPRLGVASSRDGLRWAKYSGNPVLALGAPGSFDEKGLREPMALPISRGLALFYTGHDSSGARRIGLALSPDGVRWRKTGVALDESRAPGGSRALGSPAALVLGNRLRLWHSSAGSEAGGAEHIGLATARVDDGIQLSYEHASVHPPDTRPDTPNGRWAFPYLENSIITLPDSALTFAVDVPARARFRATVRMPLPEADPARAVVRINGEQLFSELATPATEVNLDLSRFAGQRVELQLAATPTPQGQRAAWVQWLAPRITSGENP